jgi:hypothetical protein
MPIVVSPVVADVAWSDWFKDLLPHVPGCPNILAAHELLRAAQALLVQSRAWQVTQTEVPIDAAQAMETIAVAGAQLVRIEKAWYDGIRMDIRTTEELDAQFSDDWQIHTGTPKALLQITPGVVQFYPIPDVAATTGLKLRVSLKPSDTATGLPHDIAIKYREPILAGAKARLMVYPNKPWSNDKLAMFNAGIFDNGVGTATIEAARSFGRGRIASRPKWC